MDNKKDNKYYASKALESINIIHDYFGIMSYEEFLRDTMLIDAILFRLVQVVENIKNLTDGFKNKFPSIPWGEIVGFRNGIVHEYGKTDYSQVYKILAKDLKDLEEALQTLL